MNNTEHPKVFISYSWSGAEFEDRIITLGKRLMDKGIETIIDKWDLKEGQDKNAYMEKMVSDPSIHRVLVCCDRKYKEKADARKGGVGTESMIISEKVYADVGQTKFIPVVMERIDGNATLPVFMASRIYFDLSQDDPLEFDRLVRTLWGEPLHEKPALGRKPKFEKAGSELLTIISIPPDTDVQESLPVFVSELEEKVVSLEIKPPNADVKDILEDMVGHADRLRDEIAIYIQRVLSSEKSLDFKIDAIRDIFSVIMTEINITRPGTNYRGGKGFVRYLGRTLTLDIIADLLSKKNYEYCGKIMSLGIPVMGNSPRIAKLNELGRGVEFIDEILNKMNNAQKISYSTDRYLVGSRAARAKLEDIVNADLVLFVSSIVERGDGYHWVPFTTLYRDYAHGITKLFLTISSESESSVSMKLWGSGNYKAIYESVLNYGKELKYPLIPGSHGFSSPLNLIWNK